ncbi:oxygen-dependent tRNA uridine(34) hydroxylase TrhO [Wolbachia endosymbiont of Dirofilaria (Dirofilaria) immitis]|uniref:oxygen-dependent tRNA uridine(34) hydroxylase TrhO n=1 Tax=Wolbachia endosymbiont of Dirofilaria (Dirofilaria) immitis TaxID=1812115 RepID=UPI00158E8CDE|nr:rhodanese-related sulfurtransferase [Wolbachia endosymbiont of Dirofilaria (Dirofilaria) immitis]QKX02647.1 rhodanese-related sulfurtransferase [Wolbachia endosymbiont of Dirofilaria (Dirofilaria) immitis]
MSFVVATFYHFVELSNYYDMKDIIKAECNDVKLKGTILLAEEGINATISGERNAIDRIFDFLHSDHRLKDLVWKESAAEFQPFSKMKVRLKREIVNLGVSNLDISLKGKYVDPECWDDFISQPDVLVIDVRNRYEVKLGKFKDAINPNIQYFREFPQWVKSFPKDKDLKIAMYCTGGIRCEKSTAYMRGLGFNDIYHLRGGILSYLEKTYNKNGNWKGECFVFDNRIAVNNSLVPSDKIKCIFCLNQVSTNGLKSVSRSQVICSDCESFGIRKKFLC